MHPILHFKFAGRKIDYCNRHFSSFKYCHFLCLNLWSQMCLQNSILLLFNVLNICCCKLVCCVLNYGKVFCSFYYIRSPFLYGYSSATIAIIQFLFSHFKLRLLTLILVPLVQLYILDVLTVQHFGYIILTFTTQFLILLYSHYNEFMFRLAFSYMTYNLKLK